MIVIHLLQDATSLVANVTHWTDVLPTLHWHLTPDQMPDQGLLAQVRQTDLGGDIQRAFNNFVKTGQAWAFILGFVLGYMIKTFTSFG